MEYNAWRQPPGPALVVPKGFDRVPDFDPRTGEHLWTIVNMYRWNPGTESPILDMENLLTVQGPGCFYCEQVYTPQAAKRRCKGKP